MKYSKNSQVISSEIEGKNLYIETQNYGEIKVFLTTNGSLNTTIKDVLKNESISPVYDLIKVIDSLNTDRLDLNFKSYDSFLANGKCYSHLRGEIVIIKNAVSYCKFEAGDISECFFKENKLTNAAIKRLENTLLTDFSLCIRENLPTLIKSTQTAIKQELKDLIINNVFILGKSLDLIEGKSTD